MPLLKPARGALIHLTDPLARGLVAFYPLNEGCGRQLLDMAGCGHNGSLQGTFTWVPGQFGSCFRGDGSSSYIDVSDNPVHVGSGPWSVSIWFRTSDTDHNSLSVFGVGEGTAVHIYKHLGEQVWVFNGSSYLKSATSSLNDNRWHHLVVDRDPQDNAHIYLDGKLDETGVGFWSGLTLKSISIFAGAVYMWAGDIDVPAVWRRCLSPREVARLHREPFAVLQRPARHCVLAGMDGTTAELAYTVEAAAAASGTVRLTRRISGDANGQASSSGAAEVSRYTKAEVTAVSDTAAQVRQVKTAAAYLASASGLAATIRAIWRVAGTAGCTCWLEGCVAAQKVVPFEGASWCDACAAGILVSDRWKPWTGGRLHIEAQWLREALYNGVTGNAFMLGTALASGWFWFRLSGCLSLYRGEGMNDIDFVNILRADDIDSKAVSTPSYVPHRKNSTYYYVVRRFNSCGDQECTLHAATTLCTDSDGGLSPPRPNDIFKAAARQTGGDRVELNWLYCNLDQKIHPSRFNVYSDDGGGQIDYVNPAGLVEYKGRKFYTYSGESLAPSRYQYVVQPESSQGARNHLQTPLVLQVDDESPESIVILEVVNV